MSTWRAIVQALTFLLLRPSPSRLSFSGTARLGRFDAPLRPDVVVHSGEGVVSMRCRVLVSLGAILALLTPEQRQQWLCRR